MLPNAARGGPCVLTSSVEIVDNATSLTTICAAYLLLPAIRTVVSDFGQGGMGAASVKGGGAAIPNALMAYLPPFGLVGINADVESFLLNVSNVAITGITTGACNVQLSFSDVNGNILQSIVVPQLAVGSSFSSQLVFTTPPRTRVEVLPNAARSGSCRIPKERRRASGRVRV